MNSIRAVTLIIVTLNLLSLGCGKAGGGFGHDMIARTGICDGYPDPATSPYVAPFSIGEKRTVGQGNCMGYSHYGAGRYAYDIGMPIGSDVVASRGGTVLAVEGGNEDGNGCPGDNHVYIKHTDGTVAKYVHLTKGGALVAVGELINQGQKIGLSGNTGCSSGPHLHFQVDRDDSLSDSMPVTFRNISGNPMGLQPNTEYLALPYE